VGTTGMGEENGDDEGTDHDNLPPVLDCWTSVIGG